MKALLPLLIVLLLSVSLVSAQETPEASDWTTVEHCITAPSQPPDGWTYGGVIFTFKPGDGVHARRADVATSYYVAFDSDSEYGSAGRLSPDGRWFAVPEGRKRNNTAVDYWYFIHEIRVYSTLPAQETYRVGLTRVDRGRDSHYGIIAVQWLDSQHFVTWGVPEKYEDEGYYIYNPFQGETMPFQHPHFGSISPDGSTILYNSTLMSWEGDVISGVLPVRSLSLQPHLPYLYWTSDSSQFAAVLEEESSVGVFNRDGQLFEKIRASKRVEYINYPPNGETLAFSEFDGTLHIADFATHTITDTCIHTPYSIAFSPDGRQLAFGLEPAGYVYVLDLEAWEAYRIDLAAADVIGWYPLE